MRKNSKAEKAKQSRRIYSRRFFLFALLLFIAATSVYTNADLDSANVTIDNMSAYVMDSSVIIYWDTNILADSLVRYGANLSNLTESNYFGVHSYAHAAEITNLLPNTLYYYIVNSTNANGNSNETQIYNFTTLEDNLSPVYSNISIYPNASVVYSNNTVYSIRIVWKDNGILSNVTIIGNFTLNAMQDDNDNSTYYVVAEKEMQNIAGTDIYEYNISSVPAGNYTYKILASDIAGNKNETDVQTLVISKALPKMNLSINGAEQYIEIDQKSFVNISGLLEEGDSGMELFVRNSTALLNYSSANNSMNGSYTFINMLQYFESPGLYEIVLSSSETNNYAARNISYIVNVTSIEVNIFIDKPEYNLGDLVSYVVIAPNSSNLSIEICGPLPTGAGFVECKTLLNSQASNYPYMNVASFTNKSGIYKIRAQMQYKGLNKYSEKNYTVINNIQLTISGDTLLKLGQESNLVATATGGIGVIKYNWTLSNGTKISGPNLNVKYNAANTYPVVLTATDDMGNIKIGTATLTVKKNYLVKFLIIDNADSQILDSAKVKLVSSAGESDTDNVDADGYAQFDLIEGVYDMRASASGYSSYVDTMTADSNKTITVKLTKLASSPSNEPLEINLITPVNNTAISSSSANFEAYVDLGGNTLASCTFYLAESSDGWYKSVKTISLSASGQISASDAITGSNTYSWKVQCTSGTKTYSSQVRMFTSTGSSNQDETQLAVLEDGYNQVIDAGEIRRRIDTAMTNYDAMDIESKKDADALQFASVADKALKDYERSMRDINNIQYRRDLTSVEQDAKKIEYYDTIKALDTNTFLDVKDIGYQTFISYPSKEELTAISDLYKKESNIIGNIAESDLVSRQNGIIVTTRISNVEVTLLNGNKKTITLVVKSIKLSDNSTNTFLLESIPKEFAASSDDLTLLSEAKVIVKDPLLKLDKMESIVYYVEGKKDLELGKKITTVLLADTYFGTRNAITGNATLSNVDFTSPLSLIIMIVIIFGGYLIYAFDLFGKMFEKSRKKEDEQKINRILELIKDAQSLIQNKKISDADLTFKEIKLIYEGSSDTVMNEVYSEVMNLLEIIDSAQAELLIMAANENTNNLGANEKEKLIESKKMLGVAYNLLSDSLKQKYGDKINSLIKDANNDPNTAVQNADKTASS
jgi:hypothetical protein